MPDTKMVSTDQRRRLLRSTERLNQSSDSIKESRRTMLETEDIGVSILQDLRQQRQSLLHAHNTLLGVDNNIVECQEILTDMENGWTIGSIVTALVVGLVSITIGSIVAASRR